MLTVLVEHPTNIFRLVIGIFVVIPALSRNLSLHANRIKHATLITVSHSDMHMIEHLYSAGPDAVVMCSRFVSAGCARKMIREVWVSSI